MKYHAENASAAAVSEPLFVLVLQFWFYTQKFISKASHVAFDKH